MPDEFVSVTREGWGERLKNSLVGIVFGLVLGVIAFPVLFLNEGRAVKRQQTLEEGAGIVISVGSDRVDAALEGKLVHVTGRAEVSEDLEDLQFAVKAPAIRLVRSVEMFQWIEETKSEKKNKTGGGTETVTTTSYRKDWSSQLNRTSSFKEPAGHANPDAMPFESQDLVAKQVSLGVFQLPQFLVGQITNAQPLKVESLEGIEENLKAKMKLHQGGIYVGMDPSNPEVGDVKISFKAVSPSDVSVVAKQVGDSFEKYRTVAGGDLEILAMGTQSAEAMFEDQQAANRSLTWILRGVGLVMMWMGGMLVTRPLRVVADVLPIAGRIVGAGLGFFSFALAMILATITIATAWVFYRPIIGIGVLVITGIFAVMLIMKLRKAKPAGSPLSATAGDAPPPL